MSMAQAKGAPMPFPATLIFWAAASIALNVGLHRFTYGAMLPALRRDLELDYLSSGLLNAVHLAGYLAGTLVAARLISVWGPAVLSRRAHAGVGIGALVCALAPAAPETGPIVLGLGRAMTGVAAGGSILAVLVIALGAVAAERRAAASALVWSGIGAAILASALAIGLLLGPAIGWRLAFVAAAVLAFAIAAFFPPRAAPQPATEEPGTAAFNLGAALTTRWVFLIGAYFMFGVGYIAWATFAGARLAEANAPVFVSGAMWAALGVSTAIGSVLTIAVVNNRRLRSWALFASLAVAAIGCLFSAFDAAWLALTGAVVVGLGMASTPSIVSAEARARSTAADYAAAFAVATAALGTGQFVGPVLAGGLSDAYGTVAAPLLAALAYGLGAVAALVDRRVAPPR